MINKRNLRGFTLIELLVVIAIIAILAAILFPVFASAREKARATVAVSQAREIGIGVRMYVQDYDEAFPIFQAYNTLDYDGKLALPWTSGHLGVEMSILPYIKSHDIFKDPDDLGSPYLKYAYPTSVPTDSYYDAFGSSYRFTHAAFTNVNGQYGSHENDGPSSAPTNLVLDSSYTNPSNTRIMRDEEFPWFGPAVDPTGATYSYYSATPASNYYATWHPIGGVVIFADGHAKLVTSQAVWNAIAVDPKTGGSYNTGLYWGYD